MFNGKCTNHSCFRSILGKEDEISAEARHWLWLKNLLILRDGCALKSIDVPRLYGHAFKRF